MGGCVSPRMSNANIDAAVTPLCSELGRKVLLRLVAVSRAHC